MNEKVIVPSGFEPFGFFRPLGRLFREQVEGNLSHHSHVLRGMAFADARVIFVENDIQAPMQPILNPPVATAGIGKAFNTQGKRGAIDPISPGKTRITIRLDNEVLEWFREQVHLAGGGNYQTLINEALNQYIQQQSEPLEETFRRVLREELERVKDAA